MIDVLTDLSVPPNTIRAAWFETTPELIAQLFLLPEGVRITHITADVESRTIKIRVEGGDLPDVPEGSPIPKVFPQYRQKIERHPEFMGWGI